MFSHPGAGKARVVERSGAGGTERAELPGEREILSAVFANEEDDARSAVAAWHVLADALRLDRVRLVPPNDGTPPLPGLHPTRSAHLMARAGTLDEVTIGSVGEIDPAVAARFDLTRTAGGGTTPRRIGWLEVDLGLLLDEAAGASSHHHRGRGQPLPVLGHRSRLRRGRRASRRRRG